MVKDMQKEFTEGHLTQRRLDGDKAQIDKISEKVKIHAVNLRSQAAKILVKLDHVKDTVAKCEIGVASAADFMSLLKETK